MKGNIVSTIKLLENLINYCSVKNSVISKNLANIGTENYQREDVSFKSLFTSEVNSNLKTTNQKHLSTNADTMPDSNIEIVEDKNEDMMSGINNVDIEKEMADLAENTLQFKFASKKIGNYYQTLQKVIKGDSV